MNELKKQTESIIHQWRKYDEKAALPIPQAVIFAELLLLKLKSEKSLDMCL